MVVVVLLLLVVVVVVFDRLLWEQYFWAPGTGFWVRYTRFTRLDGKKH